MLAVTVPNPVVFDGMFRVKVHCAPPAVCRGDVNVQVIGKGDATANYKVAPGKTKRITVDPPFSVGKETDTVTVRIEPQGEPATEVQRRLVVRQNAGGGGSGGGVRDPHPRPLHVVTDKRGDGVARLDLRRVTAYVRHRRLVLTFSCWRRFGPADMDHDVANFRADITLHQHDPPTDLSTGVFYSHGAPFVQAGRSQFPNRRVRFSRPDRRSVRLAIPLSAFGHPKRLWIWPRTQGYRHGEDRAPPLYVRVPA